MPRRWILALALLCGACAAPEPAPVPSIVLGSRPGTLAAVPANGSAYCREFHETTTIGGVPQDTYGTACRQPDGSWRIMPQGAGAPPTTTYNTTTTYIAPPYPYYYPYAFGPPFFGSAFFFSHGHRFHHHHGHHRH
jgi:hypothetical protein